MTLDEMITLYRAQARDKQPPYFCDDDELTIYANEAQMEACRRGQLLRESSAPMARIAFAAGAELVPLSNRALKILRATIVGQPVSVLSAEEMDNARPGWQADVMPLDVPQFLITGMTTDALHLWPVPREAGEIRLTVQRLPLRDLSDGSDEPEIRREAHSALVDWMLYRVYSTEDIELYNDSKAQLALKRFEAEFGSKASVRNETWVRDGLDVMPEPLA